MIDIRRRPTDLPWTLLLLVSLSAQVILALIAISSGEVRSILTEVASRGEALNLAASTSWNLSSPLESVLQNFYLDTEDLPTLCRSISTSLMSCSLAAAVFLLLLAYTPVNVVVYSVTVVAPSALLLTGALHVHGIGDSIQIAGISAGGWPLIAVSAILLACTYFSWKHIRLGVATLRCTASFLRGNYFIVGYPFLFSLIHLVGFLLWSLALTGALVSFRRIDSWEWHLQVSFVLASMLIFLWGSACVTSLSTFVIALLVSTWFRCGSSPLAFAARPTQLTNAVVVALKYHLGSFTLGSLLLAIVQLLNIVLFWANKAEEGMMNAADVLSGRRPVHEARRPPSFVRALRSFAADVLEVAATWASKQAFVQIAISGSNFSKSAMTAAELVRYAPASFLVVESLSRIEHRICEFLFIAMSVGISYLLGFEGFKGLMPSAFAAWIAAESLLHPYTVATTTLLHCCLQDYKQCNNPKPGTVSADDARPAAVKALMKTMQSLDTYDDSFVQHYSSLSRA